MSFASNMSKRLVKIYAIVNIAKKLLHHPKQSAKDALKTASKRAIQKTASGTGDLVGNKIANTIPKVPKNFETE